MTARPRDSGAGPNGWYVGEGMETVWYSDRALAAAFRPAEDLDQLIAAARALLAELEGEGYIDVNEWELAHAAGTQAELFVRLREALRQWEAS